MSGIASWSCLSLRSYAQLFFKSCTLSVEERQKQSAENLVKQLSVHQYQMKDLTKKIEDCETHKIVLVRAKKINEAKDKVREKHKLLKKLTKTRELADFTESLLEKISDTAMMKSTIESLNEAQTLFKAVDAPKLYKKFDKLSEQYTIATEDIAATNDLIADRMGSSLMPPVEEAELLKELEQLELELATGAEDAQQLQRVAQPPVAPKPSENAPVAFLQHAEPAAPAARNVASAYAKAGLV